MQSCYDNADPQSGMKKPPPSPAISAENEDGIPLDDDDFSSSDDNPVDEETQAWAEEILAADRETDRLYEQLTAVAKAIDAISATGNDGELDALTIKKEDLQQKIDSINLRIEHLLALAVHSSAKSDPTDLEQPVPTVSFSDVVEEDISKLAPAIRKVKEMEKRAKSNSLTRENRPLPSDENFQLDLFIANLLDYNLKDDTATMEAPVFSLSTKLDLKIWKWESADKKRWLEVTPSVKGRATMHDKDVLIYLTSQLMSAMNESLRSGQKMPGRRVRFTLYDYLRATGRDTSGRAYSRFVDSLDRLAGTRLKTNMVMQGKQTLEGFGLIEKYQIVRTDDHPDERMVSIEIVLSEFLYSAVEQKEVLTISHDYFDLRRPLEKRLYELARKHVGTQQQWKIKEDLLYEKTGSQASSKEFRRMLGEIIAADSIPDHKIMKTTGAAGDSIIVFMNKQYQKAKTTKRIAR